MNTSKIIKAYIGAGRIFGQEASNLKEDFSRLSTRFTVLEV